jgi:predicted ferric reductase
MLITLALSMLLGHNYLIGGAPLFENKILLFVVGIIAGILIGIIAAVFKLFAMVEKEELSKQR